MFKNYVLITVRNLFRNKVYSFINIVGLAVGLTCSILILLWVQDETSFDTFHPKADRLYQVWLNADWGEEGLSSQQSLPLPTYEALKTANSHIVRTAVSDWGSDHLLAVGENPIIKEGYFVSEEFLEMFEFELQQGTTREKMLDDPSSIVITASTARALFDDEDPVGKVVRVDDKHDLRVIGVLEDVPANSSFEFDFLLPWKLNEQTDWIKGQQEEWDNHSFQVYAELDDPTQKADVENSVLDLVNKNSSMDIERNLFLYPLARWRLHSSFKNGVETGGMIEYVQLFTIVAIFILIIACINFMNLATARSERRAREVGIRKSVGSHRRELIMQFIGESLFITFLAFLLALLLTELALPFYNELVEKELFIDYTSVTFWLASLGIVLFTGVVAGSYPAFYLSSFQPARVLKGKVKTGKNASTPRKVLVTLQFGFSILFIVNTIVIYQQIQLIQSRELGYRQENLINVQSTDALQENYEVLKNELLQSGLVEAVTRSNSPITNIYSTNFLGWPGKPEEQRVLFTTITADYDYTKTMGIKVLEGRDFSEEFVGDTAAILVNQAAMDIMQLEDPLGTQLETWDTKRTLIGIIDNVLMGSPHEPVRPMFVVLDDWDNSLTLRLAKTDDLPAALAGVEDIFRKYNSAYPFEYEFADVEFQEKYTTINLTKHLANLFTGLALLITGLGLFGLASYTAEQRTKEIGIRKVLGASVFSIIRLMSRDFSRLVIIAFVLFTPLAWWDLNSYLERYEIRTEIHWWIFPLTGAVVLLFALAFVITQAVRAAQGNPAQALRSE